MRFSSEEMDFEHYLKDNVSGDKDLNSPEFYRLIKPSESIVAINAYFSELAAWAKKESNQPEKAIRQLFEWQQFKDF